ncbi:hypothetical protein EV715DRAFT_214748 [Schizophyllum commune]
MLQLAVADEPAPPAYSASPPSPAAVPSEPVATHATPSTARAVESRSCRGRPAKRPGYVVFLGKTAGVYTTWYVVADACNSQVAHVSHSVHHKYDSLAEAQAAFDVALGRGLTYSCGEGSIVVGRQRSAERLSPADLVLCLAFMDDETSMAMAPARHSWYVVYQGLQPGVYRTYVEVMLSTSGLQDAVHDKYKERDAAVDAFTSALQRGSVYRLTRSPAA